MKVGKLAGAVGVYGGGDPEMERVACGVLGLMPEPAATQVVPRDRHAELLSALALRRRPSSVSPPRSGISPARRWARSASPSARARRALRRCRTSAIRWWPSEFVASRASSVQQPWSGRKTSHSGTSATFHTRAPSGSSSRTLPGARLHARPLRVARGRPGCRRQAHAGEPRVVARARLLAASAVRTRRVRSRPGRGLSARAAPRTPVLGRGHPVPRASSSKIPRSAPDSIRQCSTWPMR